jgi:5,10-methylene-tetrahydrofolate dehydrogenase/methenyl tetrahydrofolate cyclohydrolase
VINIIVVIINNQPLSRSFTCETIINIPKDIIKQIYNTNVVVIGGSIVVKIPARLADVIYDFNVRSCVSNN